MRVLTLSRRELVAAGLAGAPLLLGAPVRAARREPLALVTADTEAHVAAVSLATGRIRSRVRTREGPRSIEGRGGLALVAHSALGLVTLLSGGPLEVRRVLRGFGAPRYAAITADRRHAFVSDSANGELAVVDLRGARVVRRVAVGDGARHLGLDPSGRLLWVSLGSSASRIAVVDVRDPPSPRVVGGVQPPFLAHDVGFSPSGRRVWVTAGRERRLAIYARGGREPEVIVRADDAPQHVAFGRGLAYVASGDGRSMRVHRLSDGGLVRGARVALGSYNVHRGFGRVLTPSLSQGTLTALDARGRVLRIVRVARAAHDVTII